MLLLSLILPFAAMAQQKRVGVRTADPQEQRMSTLELELGALEAELRQLQLEQDSMKLVMGKQAIITLDLGVSLQQFKTTPMVYYTDREGEVHSLRYGSEFQGALNLLLSYRIHKEHHMLLNLPVFSMSSGLNPGVGLFNKEFGMGLGYAYRWHRHKLFGSVNLQPFSQPDLQLLKERARYQEPYTHIDISDVPSYRRYNPGFSLGYGFELWSRR